MNDYPTFESLGTAADYLWIDIPAILRATRPPEQVREPPAERTRTAKRARHARQYRSRFVGVTVHRNRWVGFVDAAGTKHGPKRPMDDAGEVQAAWDRAVALGRPGLELRPLHQVAPRDVPSPALEARGPHQTPLGGKRVA